MADEFIRVGQGAQKRLRDMGDGSHAEAVIPAPYAAVSVASLANDGAAWTEVAPAAGVLELVIRPQDPAATLKVAHADSPGSAYELVPAGEAFAHPATASVWVQLSTAGNLSVRSYS